MLYLSLWTLHNNIATQNTQNMSDQHMKVLLTISTENRSTNKSSYSLSTLFTFKLHLRVFLLLRGPQWPSG